MTGKNAQLQQITHQGPARALIHSKGQDEEQAVRKRAVLYLRVSSVAQVNTDYDPEGISIPAQRVSCERKAAHMGVEIIEEYVEPGKSATKMDQRPAFQSMLERIKNDRDVDYVIVYKLSRMNRNWIDSAIALMTLRTFHVSLISATENIDDSPEGQLMLGVLAAMNQFRSEGDGADIRFKMGEKARRGGTLGRAPIGYINVRERFEGREVRTIALDPERAPFVKLAFELFATGEYTLDLLRAELTDRGLVSRPNRYPAGPISSSKLQSMLRDRYYAGVITYKGVEYPGRHDAIITEELFAQVQAVFETRATAGERIRKHPHYLKGSIWCGRCHNEGIESRLLVQRAVGRRGGEYYYFFCSRKQAQHCVSPYAPVEEVEDAVARCYDTMRLKDEFAEVVRASLSETLSDRTLANRLARQQLTGQLATLDKQEENLLDLAGDADIPKDKLRTRLRRIQAQRTRVEEQLERTDDRLEVAASLLEAALDLLNDPRELYRRSGPKYRRLLNQAVFKRLYIDHNEVTDHCLNEPFAELHEAQTRMTGKKLALDPRRRANSVVGHTKADLLVTALSGGGSSKTAMVEVMGLEPTTSTLRT
jgi:site-specific DNA recombinase